MAIGGCGDGEGLPPVDRSLFAYDRARPLAPVTGRGTRWPGDAVLERVAFRSFDGDRVPALFVRPEDARAVPCVLFQHGFGSDKRDGAMAATPLARQGIATMAIDARFHGQRAGAAGVTAVAASPRLLYRMFRETTIDLRRALDYLGRRRACDPARLGFVGASFGAMVGALLAGADKRVQAPVLLVGGGDWQEFLEGSDVFLPGIEAKPAAYERALGLLDPVDPARWAPRISPRPVLIAYGTRDSVVVPEAAEALAGAAREPKEIVTHPGEHGDVLASREVIEAVDSWMAEQLADR